MLTEQGGTPAGTGGTPLLLGEEDDLQLSTSERLGLARSPAAKMFFQRKNCFWKGDECVRVMVTQSEALGQ